MPPRAFLGAFLMVRAKFSRFAFVPIDSPRMPYLNKLSNV